MYMGSLITLFFKRVSSPSKTRSKISIRKQFGWEHAVRFSSCSFTELLLCFTSLVLPDHPQPNRHMGISYSISFRSSLSPLFSLNHLFRRKLERSMERENNYIINILHLGVSTKNIFVLFFFCQDFWA